MGTIKDHLKQIADLTKGSNQSEYNERRYNLAHEVEIVSVKEVLTENEIRLIKSQIKPKCKECYKNATLFTSMFDATFVSGQMEVCGFGIDHAFNKIRGKYIDITAEFALSDKGIKTSSEYVSIAEYSRDEVMKAMLDMGCYDDPFRYYFVTKVLGRSW